MASQLTNALLDSAAAPLRKCAELLRTCRVRDAVAALARPLVEQAWRDGLAALSVRSGARLDALQRAVPADRVEAALARLDAAQKPVAEALVRYLASTVSLAPPAPGVQPASAELRAVAARYALDRHIAEPIEALADAVSAWEALLEQLGTALPADRSVLLARLRRWTVRGVMVLTALLAVLFAAGFGAWNHLVVQTARARVDAALDGADPCAWEALAGKDLSHATPAQLVNLEARKRQCAEQRAKDAYEASCAALADHVASGALEERDVAAAGGAAALLRRMAARQLEPSDLLLGPGVMPCQDSRAAARFWDDFTRLAGTSSSLWNQAEAVSLHVASLLKRPGFGLSPPADEVLLAYCDGLARRAIKSGNPDELARASRACLVRPALGLEEGRGCAALARIEAR